MALSITKTIASQNGWKNLYTQAKADGYTGNAIVKEATVVNNNATVAYLHITADGGTQPATGSDGLPIGTSGAPSSAFTLPRGTDIATVWIYTSAGQDIKYSVIGA